VVERFSFLQQLFFRKLVFVHQKDEVHGFEKIGRWIKGINSSTVTISSYQFY